MAVLLPHLVTKVRNSSLLFKLTIGIFLLGGVVILIGLTLSYIVYQTQVEKEAIRSLGITADISEGYVLEYLEGLKTRTKDFSSDKYIQDHLGTIADSSQLSEYLIQNKQLLDKSIVGINIFDNKGKIIASTDKSGVGTDRSDDINFRKAINLNSGETYLSDVTISKDFKSDTPLVVISTPIFKTKVGGEPTIVGILANYVSLDALNKLVSGERQIELGAPTGMNGMSKTLDIYLVNSDGYMITQSKFAKDAVLKQKIDSPFIKSCSKGEEVSAKYKDYRGVDVVGVSMCFRNGSTLIAEMDLSEVYATVYWIQAVMLLVSFISLFIIFEGVYAVVKISLKPLDRLVKASEEVRNGNFNVKIDTIGNNEIGRLARSFNFMVSNLQEMFLSLESRVKKRTNELAARILELGKEKAQDEAILNSIGEALVVTDKESNIVLVNKVFEIVMGWKSEEILGKNYLDVVPMYDVNHILITKNKRFLNEVLSGANKKEVSSPLDTYYYETRDKTKIPIYRIATPIILEDEIIGAVIVFRDISFEKEIDRTKDEFISLASHELRTPLTAIDGLVSMILKNEYGKVSDSLKKPLNDISISSGHLIHLVNDLLNVSRIQGRRSQFKIEDFHLKTIVERTVSLLKSVAQNKGLSVKFESENDPLVQADSEKVGQILSNLVGNAIKFTDKGGVNISIKEDGEKVKVLVKDTGIGISAEDRKKLFEKFEQIQSKRDQGGTGLGLYLSKALAKTMGGDVWLESSDTNKGSTFAFYLPKAGSGIASLAKTNIEAQMRMLTESKPAKIN